MLGAVCRSQVGMRKVQCVIALQKSVEAGSRQAIEFVSAEGVSAFC